MSKLISVDHDFQNANRIVGLPPATANGQPLTYEQLGGAAPVEVVTITIPARESSHEQTISVPGILPTQSVRVWLASTTSDDENDIFLLEGVQVWGLCATDEISFFFSSQTPESGPVKLNYQVA